MIRVFPRRTKWTPSDELAFVGDPPLIRPPQQPVAVSCTFTWDRMESERLARAWSRFYSDVRLGGPAFDDAGAAFVPGRFIRKGGVFTSRGCIRNCRFCFVPRREGPLRELPITEGSNILDNNLLACSREHIEAVFRMLRSQPEPVRFSGGLDTRLLSEWHIELLRSVRLKFAWFACDSFASVTALERSAKLLEGFSREKLRCYVLVGFDGERPRQAEERLEQVYLLGFLPFAMLYRGPDSDGRTPREWHDLVGRWRSPAAYKAIMRVKHGA